MTILKELSTALSKFCATCLRSDAQVQSRRLTGYLLSIPLITSLTLVTNPWVLSSSATALSLAALAFAIPLIFIAWLSKYNCEKTPALFTIALAPTALFLITQGHLNTFIVAVLLLVILAKEAREGYFERAQLGMSAVLTFSIASILVASNGGVSVQFGAVLGVLPAACGGIVYLLFERKPDASIEQNEILSQFEIASLVALENGAVAFEIDRAARVHGVSSNSFEILHLNKLDLNEKAFLNRVHIADKVFLLSEVDAVANGKSKARLNIRLKTSNTSARHINEWVHVSCSVFAMKGNILLMIKQQEQPAMLAEPVASISKSALTMVSHELRTPLNAILGFSDLMGKGLAGEIANERQREYIGLIHQSGQHLLELVNSILDLSKLESGTYELEAAEYLPAQAAEFAVSMLAMQAVDKHIGLNYLPLCGLDAFCGDSRVAQQIIINLLSNAVKFTPNHGQITLKVEMDCERLIISVTDTGVGMTKDELNKVGTPFYQVSHTHSRQNEGAGLGLSLVRQLAILHGGAIEIGSEHGKGTSVRVALASLNRKEKVVSYLKHTETDESVRFIQVNEERIYGTSRKTA